MRLERNRHRLLVVDQQSGLDGRNERPLARADWHIWAPRGGYLYTDADPRIDEIIDDGVEHFTERQDSASAGERQRLVFGPAGR